MNMRVKATVTLPFLWAKGHDIYGNEIRRGAKCTVGIFAVKPEWYPAKGLLDGLQVGEITFNGYTETPFKRSVKIILPDGYKVVAMRIDDCGLPIYSDFLLVQLSECDNDSVADAYKADLDNRVAQIQCGTIQDASEDIRRIVRDEITKQLQPGGAIWCQLK